jgi:hypothetical protein
MKPEIVYLNSAFYIMPSIAFTKQGRAKKQLAAALASAESVFGQSIHLSCERGQYLAGLASKHLHPPGFYHVQQLPSLHVKTFNLSAELFTCLLAAGLAGAIEWKVSYSDQQQLQQQVQQQQQQDCQQQCEQQQELLQQADRGTAAAAAGQESEDYIGLLDACRLPPACNLLLIELRPGAQALTYAEQCAAAFALLSCVPVAFVAAEWGPAIDEAARSPAGRVWGVCSSFFELEEVRGTAVGATSAAFAAPSRINIAQALVMQLLQELFIHLHRLQVANAHIA